MFLELPAFLRKPGIRAMEILRKTDAACLLPDLLESELWPLDRLEALQAERLSALGRFCQEEVPYYHDFLEGLRLDPENLTRLPLMTKDIIRLEGSRLQSRSFTSWQPRAKSTSGSTGQPLNYFLDRPSHSYQWGHLWRGWHQVGYQPGDLYATLSGGSLVPEKVDFKQKVYLALNRALHFPSYHLTEQIMEGYLATLQRRSIPFLYGYPSSLELFAEYILAGPSRALPMKAVSPPANRSSPPPVRSSSRPSAAPSSTPTGAMTEDSTAMNVSIILAFMWAWKVSSWKSPMIRASAFPMGKLATS